MKNIIEIKANIATSQELSFTNLLKEIEKFVKRLSWAILHLNATGDLGDNKSILDLEAKIAKSPNGKNLDWKELYTLSGKFYQIIEMTLVGTENINSFKKFYNDSELYLNYPLVIKMIDGYLWEIYSKDKELINHLKNVFSDT